MSYATTKPTPTAAEVQASFAKYFKENGISAISEDQQAQCAAKCSASIGQEQGTGRAVS